MNQDVQQKFATYPKHVALQLSLLRELILSVAKEENITDIAESLKWGEPSYACKGGSTIRFDWKVKSPEEYCLYFNCKTTLIETIKEVYGNLLTYQGNRAIVLKLEQEIPVKVLSHCISMSLRYKDIKHLPLLGA